MKKLVCFIFVFLFTTYPSNILAQSKVNKTLTLEKEWKGRFKFFNFSTISPGGRYAVLRAYEDGPRKDYYIIYDLSSVQKKCEIPTIQTKFDGTRWSEDDKKLRIYSATPALIYTDIDVVNCQISPLSKHDTNAFDTFSISPSKDKILAAGAQVEIKAEDRGFNVKLNLPIVKIWATDGTLNHALEIEAHDEKIYDSAFTSDGEKFITLSADNTARIWDVKAGNELKKIKFPSGPLKTITVSPQGNLAAFHTKSWSDNRILYVVDIETGKIKSKIDSRRKADKEDRKFYKLTGSKAGKGFKKAWFSPDGSRLFALGNDISLFDAKSGRKLNTIVGNTEFMSHPQSADIFISHGHHALYVHDSTSGNILGQSERDRLPRSINLRGHASIDGKKAIVHGDYKVQIWGITDLACTTNCEVKPYGKAPESENLVLLKQAIDRKDMDTADAVLRRLKNAKVQLPESLHLDYVEFLILEEEIYFSAEYLKRFRINHTPQSVHWERALKLNSDFYAMVDRKIREFQQKGNFNKVNARLEGRPHWTAIEETDYSIIFYDVVRAAIKAGRRDVAKTYLNTYSKVNGFDKGHTLRYHHDLMKLFSSMN